MTSIGFEAKSGAIFQMISDLDTDGSGAVDFGEWLTLMTKRVNDKDTRSNIGKIMQRSCDIKEFTDFRVDKRVRAVVINHCVASKCISVPFH